MGEQFERFKRFEYRMNSNLVIQRDGPAPRLDEATGEPESLAGRVLYKMGDKVTHESIKSKVSSKRKVQAVPTEPTRRRKTYLDLNKDENILNIDINLGLKYLPKSNYTRGKYQEMLTILQKVLGDQPQSVLLSACDETLLALKAENLPEQRRELVEDVLGPLPDEQYYNLFHLSKELTDFTTDADQDFGVDPLDDTGVAVIFDEDDNMETTEVVETNMDDQENDEIDPQLGIRYLGSGEDKANLENEEDLNINKIDGYWLQRELNFIYNDYNVAQATEKEIMSILNIEDVQECENKLVLLLKYENFDFAKLLLRNRYKIIYCTRLGQAQSQEEKNKIFDEMGKTTQGQVVLNELSMINLKKTKQQQLAHNLEKELMTMKTGSLQKDVETKGEDSLVLPEEHLDARENEVQQPRSSSTLQVVDLENLAIKDGSQHMSNVKVVLPEGTERVEHKSYDEVIIHAVHHMPKSNMKKISRLPKWAQPAFKNMDTLNPVQSTVFETAFNTTENMLICAPTGSGKTNVAILTILNVFRKHLTPKNSELASGSDLGSGERRHDLDDLELSQYNFDKEFTVIYISPMKSLVLEQTQSFNLRFQDYGISVHELTGEMSMTRTQIQNTQVIVTTPEKWDVVTRKEGMLERVELVIIDEVHLLHDKRGSVIEALVARTMMHDKVIGLNTRIVGLSATLPNYEDIAKFLRVDKGLYYFGNHYRPVPLEQHYLGIKEKKALKMYNITNELTYDHVVENVEAKQVLVFVHSRKETYRTSKMILEKVLNSDKMELFIKDPASVEILKSEAEHIKNANLKELLPFGIGIHHAGLARSDRKLVEDLFSDKHLKLLVSTATLSWGVNLPAGVVIIKGTQIYVPEEGCWDELCPLSVQQMMGRAGRPQYDNFGKGIIITSHEKLQYYLSLNNQQLPIESQLVPKLPEILNAEIVLRNVTNLHQALEWMKTTYLYVRIQKNPQLYGFNVDSVEDLADEEDENEEKEQTLPKLDMEALDNYLLVLINSSFVLLEKNGLVKYERKSGMVTSTGLGVIASNYYLRPESIKIYSDSLRQNMTDSDILNIFSCSVEFKYIPTREEEILELQQLQQQIPIPCSNANLTATTIANRVAAAGGNNKIAILLQAYISRLDMEGYALVSEMGYITQNAPRILTALFVIGIKRGWSSLSIKLYNLCKMVENRMWQLMIPLRHFKTIPNEIITRLEKKDISWNRYYDLNTVELGELCRNPKLGKSLYKFVHMVPKVNVKAYVQPITINRINVHLVIKSDFNWDPKYHFNHQKFLLIIEDPSEDKILHTQSFLMYPPAGRENFSTDQEAADGEGAEDSDDSTNIYLTLPVSEPRVYCYFIRVINDKWVGSETNVPIIFDKLILPNKQDKATTLLDLQPIPLNTLLKSEFTRSSKDKGSKKYSDKEGLLVHYIRNCGYKYFNNIQTQVFSTMYGNDENVLLSAPYGSGRFTCAELAILRALLQFEGKTTVLVVVPFENLLKKRFKRLKERLGELCSVVELLGEPKEDLHLVLTNIVCVTTAKNCNYLMNRYKSKLVPLLNLMVVEGVEFISDEVYGTNIELLLTQLRYCTTLYNKSDSLTNHATTNHHSTNHESSSDHKDKRTRLVAISTSLYNTQDICNWLGINTHFNFNNFSRQVPITVNLYTFDQIDPVTRQNSMITTINKLMKMKDKVVVVTTNTTYTKHLALILDLQLSNLPNHFAEKNRLDTNEEFGEIVSSLYSRFKLLKQLKRVLYIYEGFTHEEVELVEELFMRDSDYRVLLVTSQVLWNLNIKCPYVIVADVNSNYTNRPLPQKYYPQCDLQYLLSLTNFNNHYNQAVKENRQSENEDLEIIFLLETNKKEEVKRMLYDSVVVESNLASSIEDPIINEIVQGQIKGPQDAIDWLTWTFYYRRLAKNPNYYSLISTTPQHISEHLSVLIENAFSDLENMSMITSVGKDGTSAAEKMDREDLDEIAPLNLGYISSFYSIKCTTTYLFAANVKENVPRDTILKLLSDAEELSTIQMRPTEKMYNRTLQHLSVPQKILLLLKCHMQRISLSTELYEDLHFVLKNVTTLLYALIDVMSTNGFLKAALSTMELFQRIVQALSFDHSPLLQLPHSDDDLVRKAKGMKVNDLFDLIQMEDEDRMKLLEDYSDSQVNDIANFCNSIQILDVTYKLSSESVKPLETVTMIVNIVKEGETSFINAPYFPVSKREQWWIVLGDTKQNKLYAIKRTTLEENNRVKLYFESPRNKGKVTLTMYVISDSYISTDYHFNLELNVV